MNTEFWWGNLKEGDHIEDLAVDGRIILERCGLGGNELYLSGSG